MSVDIGPSLAENMQKRARCLGGSPEVGVELCQARPHLVVTRVVVERREQPRFCVWGAGRERAQGTAPRRPPRIVFVQPITRRFVEGRHCVGMLGDFPVDLTHGRQQNRISPSGVRSQQLTCGLRSIATLPRDRGQSDGGDRCLFSVQLDDRLETCRREVEIPARSRRVRFGQELLGLSTAEHGKHAQTLGTKTTTGQVTAARAMHVRVAAAAGYGARGRSRFINPHVTQERQPRRTLLGMWHGRVLGAALALSPLVGTGCLAYERTLDGEVRDARRVWVERASMPPVSQPTRVDRSDLAPGAGVRVERESGGALVIDGTTAVDRDGSLVALPRKLADVERDGDLLRIPVCWPALRSGLRCTPDVRIVTEWNDVRFLRARDVPVRFAGALEMLLASVLVVGSRAAWDPHTSGGPILLTTGIGVAIVSVVQLLVPAKNETRLVP